MAYAGLEGVRLYYEKHGQGEPLLLLAGNIGRVEEFDGQVPVFEAKYSVYALEPRGHGRSSDGKEPLSYRLLARDVVEFLDSQGIHKANFLGVAGGANVALEIALGYPERVLGMALLGANLSPKGLAFGYKLGQFVKLCCTALVSFCKKGKRAFRRARLTLREPQIPLNRLSEVKAPVLVIAAGRDRVRYEHTVALAEGLANARMAVFKGQDRYVLERDPDAFNKRVWHFFWQKEEITRDNLLNADII